jgi:hypothetical protein
MSMIESIASFSTARAQAEVKTEAAFKTMKIAQDQNEVAANLISDTMEAVEEMIGDFAGELGGQLDQTA